MADPAMQPDQEPQSLGDVLPGTVPATLTWNGNSVSISLPDVGGEGPQEAKWNQSVLTEDTSTSRWDSSTSDATGNKLMAMYSGHRYKNTNIARDATSVTLTLQT